MKKKMIHTVHSTYRLNESLQSGVSESAADIDSTES